MKRPLIVPLVSLLLSSGLVYAQRPERVAQALRDRYGTMQTEVAAPREINNVKVFEVDVRGERGSSLAYVTEYGDFISSGIATAFSKLPGGVRDLRDLFRASPENVDTYIADGYYFDVRRGADNRIYRLRHDAVGRLREIINPDEVERADFTRFDRAGADLAKKVAEANTRRIPDGARLRDAFKDPRYPGFYVLRFSKPDGREFNITANEEGAVISLRSEIQMNEVPPGIRDSFTRMFDPNKIATIWRGRTQYAQFQQKTDRGDVVTFRVRPDGTVIDVRSTDLLDEDRAALTGQRQPPQTDRNRPGAR